MQHPTFDRFKNNGKNFLIQLPTSRNQGQGASGATVVPEDLVQIQSYLRWERNGKQSYTPDQEKAGFNISLRLMRKGT
jgi:alpha-glucan,water dikinase